MERECQPVQLEPFVHQVGGSSSVLCFDTHTICKPLIPREHHFYETMPQDMREFTPEHRGVVEVRFQEDDEGYVNLVAYPINKSLQHYLCNAGSPSSGGDTAQSDSDTESPEQSHSKQRFRLKRSGSIEIEAVAGVLFEQVNPLNGDEDTATYGHNPWSLRCHMIQLAKMKKANTDSDPPKFLLLENLTSHFKLPCILDLKMGTRQHGDDSSEEKRRIHTEKCQNSTSGSLGVRVCGMQVYQADTRRFVCHDKYYGRQLTVQGFYQTLYQFMHNGVDLRRDMIDHIIVRIEKLRQILRRHETYRFYSSSLLIMYDGTEVTMDTTVARDVSTVTRDVSTVTRDVSTGTAETQWNAAPAHRDQSCCTSDAIYTFPMGTTDQSGGTSCDKASWDTSLADHERLRKAENTDSNRQVDVRMIDFAHATHKGFHDNDQIHHGLDEGYLFGLENLISAFCQIRDGGITQLANGE